MREGIEVFHEKKRWEEHHIGRSNSVCFAAEEFIWCNEILDCDLGKWFDERNNFRYSVTSRLGEAKRFHASQNHYEQQCGVAA